MSDIAKPAARLQMSVIGPVVALIVLIVVGALMNPNFLAWDNITNVLARSAFIGIIAIGICELGVMRSESPAVTLQFIRLGHLAFGFVVPASLLFIHCLFGTGRLWLLLAAIGLRTTAVVANYTTGESLHFLSIGSLEKILFLGEPVSIVGEGVENPWVRLGQLAALAQIAYQPVEKHLKAPFALMTR